MKLYVLIVLCIPHIMHTAERKRRRKEGWEYMENSMQQSLGFNLVHGIEEALPNIAAFIKQEDVDDALQLLLQSDTPEASAARVKILLEIGILDIKHISQFSQSVPEKHSKNPFIIHLKEEYGQTHLERRLAIEGAVHVP